MAVLSLNEALMAQRGFPPSRSRFSVAGGLGAGMSDLKAEFDAEYARAQAAASNELSKLGEAARRVSSLASEAASAARGIPAAMEAAATAREAASAVAAGYKEAQNAVASGAAAVNSALQAALRGQGLVSGQSVEPLRAALEVARSNNAEAGSLESEARNAARQAKSIADEAMRQAEAERQRALDAQRSAAEERARAVADEAARRADEQRIRDAEARSEQERAARDAQLRADEAARRAEEQAARLAEAQAAREAAAASSQAQVAVRQVESEERRYQLDAEARREEAALQLELKRLELEEERLLRQEEREDRREQLDTMIKLVQAGLIPNPAAQASAPQGPAGVQWGPQQQVTQGTGTYMFAQPAPVVAPQYGGQQPMFGPGIEYAPAFDPGNQMFGLRGMGAAAEWCTVANKTLPSGARVACGYKISGPYTDSETKGQYYWVTRPNGKQFSMSFEQATGQNKNIRDPETSALFYTTAGATAPAQGVTREDVRETGNVILDLVGKAAGYATDAWRKVTGREPEYEPELRSSGGGGAVGGLLTAGAVLAVGYVAYKAWTKPRASNPRRRRGRRSRRGRR